MIKAVLFDLDNTLVDFVSFKNKAINSSIKAMISAGLKMKESDAVALMHNLYRRTFYESSTIFQEFLQEVNKGVDFKILSAGIVAYRKSRYFNLKPYKDAEQVLRLLKDKKFKLGVVTDAPKVKAWVRLTNIGLVDYFDFVLTFDDSNRRKPSTAPFKKALKILNLKPEQVLFVGDNPEKDIKGAKKLGMKTALAEYGRFVEQSEVPDYELRNIKDLLFLLD